MKIEATKVGIIDEADEYRVIIFSDEKENSLFQIQDAYQYDEQDVQLGMNSYYLEVNYQSNCCYGGISELELKNSSLMIQLTENAANKLKMDKIEIRFSEDKFEVVKKEISRMASKHRINLNKE